MYKRKGSLRDISLDKYPLYCHPEALTAYQLSEKYSYQYIEQLDKLPSDTIKKLQYLEPIHVATVKHFDKKSSKYKIHYQFFSGWFWLSLCRKKDIKKVRVIVYPDDNKHYFEEVSWLYMLACEFTCMNKKIGLGQMHQTMEQLPKPLKKQLLGDSYSWSSNQTIQNLSNENAKKIRAQADKLTLKTSPKKSILDELLKGN